MQSIIFLHIPKTGGSTLKSILLHQYPKGQTLSSLHTVIDEFEAMSADELSRYRCFHGHINYGLHEKLPQDARYITLLRDPLDREVSDYFFIRRKSAHRLHEFTQKHSLLEFMQYRFQEQELDNTQVRMLSGIDRNQEVTQLVFEQAVANLTDSFVVVGTTEYFDESIILMKRFLDWKTPFYTKGNVTKDRPNLDDIPSEAMEFAYQHLSFELKLYDYVRQSLQEQIKKQGPSFLKEVEHFQRMNSLYQFTIPYLAFPRRFVARFRN